VTTSGCHDGWIVVIFQALVRTHPLLPPSSSSSSSLQVHPFLGEICGVAMELVDGTLKKYMKDLRESKEFSTEVGWRKVSRSRSRSSSSAIAMQ